MSNAALDASPEALSGTIRVGQGRTWTCTDESGNGWPASTRLVIEDHAGAEQTLTPTISGTSSELATWTVTIAEAAALRGTKTTGSLRATITTGTGDALRPVKAGRLSIVSKWDGVRSAQSLGTVTLGPEGPTAVSADAGNAAELGTDGLLYVSPTAGSAHVIKDEGVALTNRAALNFAGAGVTVFDDADNGATLVTISASGGVTDHGALAGLADDDHTQYLNNARGDARYSALNHNHTGTYDPAGTAASAVSGHAGGTGVHSIAGVTGLQTALDGKQASGSYAASSHTHPASQVSDSTATGRAVVTATDAAAARTAIGAGTSSLVIGTGAGDAKAGDYTPDLSGYVPTSRTVAGKALTGNITLAAGDLTDHTEATQDIIGAMVAAAGGSYNDAAGTITLPTSSSAVIADDTPAVPAEGESATYFVTSAVAWPEGLVWSTDPDGDTEPTVTETALVSMFTVGGLTYAVMGATFLAPIVATVPAAPGSFLTVADADSITLTWAAPANGGSAITGYKVYRGTVSGALTLRATLGDVLTYDDTTATPGTTYYYTASAVNAIGEGPQSMEAGTAISTGPTLVLADDFNRASNGVINEAGSNPGSTSTGNVPWQSSAIHTWGIVDNGMVGLDSNSVAYVETGEADVAVEVKIGSGKQNYDGIAVRHVDSSNYYRIGWAPALFVYKVTAGSTTVIQSEGSPVATFVAGDVLRAEAIGSSWTIKKNGATVFTFTDATHQTGTKHGLSSASSIITAQRWDDFKVYAL